MDKIIVSDAYRELKEEIQQLQAVLAELTSERDDLKYHICPELAARYAREIGDYQNRLNYQKMMILEMKRRIEIARAALNREKTISWEEVDEQINEEYKDFHEKVNEEFKKSEQTKRAEREKEERQKQYEERWQEQFGDRQKNSDDSGRERETDSAGNKGSRMPDARELYRKIIKKLHPDMNPDITEREKDLFNKAVKAYQEGDIATLQEIYDEVFGNGAADILTKELTYDELVELRSRLKVRIGQLQREIHQIKQEYPYLLKAFLDDEKAVREKQAEFEEEIHQNEETLKRLQKILEEINREMENLRKKQA